MPGRQVRLEEAVVAAVQERRAELGFPPDAPDGAVISELAREGMQARIEAQRRRQRIALYAEWAEERDLSEETGNAMRSAVQDGVA